MGGQNGGMPGAEGRRWGLWCFVALVGVSLVVISGCGSGGSRDLVIEGDRSFGGMRNPGTLDEAIERFGYPDELFSPYPETRYMCVARWKSEGIDAQFVNWGGVGASDGPPCQPRSRLNLTGVALHGNWETDAGLKVGDSVARLNRLYEPDAEGTCSAGLSRKPDRARMLRQVRDPLGGPGSYICTLGVVISGGVVTGFVMSSRAASE